TDPGKYTTVLELGCLQLLEQAAPEVPLWLQYVIIYELTWTLRAEEAMYSATSSIEATVAARFHELVSRIREHLSTEAIESFPLIKRSTTQFEALAYGYAQENWRWHAVVVDSLDEDRRLVELRYHYAGTMPHEVTRFRGKPIEPVAAKTRDFTYLRRTLIHERILWLPADGTVEILLDGTPVPVTFGWPKPRQFSIRPAQVQAQRGSQQKQKPKARLLMSRKSRAKISATDRFVSSMARSAPIRRMFTNAWVLMDRDVNANDNAEHLFRYLRKRRRDINAWFVVEKNSPDWNRLRAEGYKRLVPYGSTLWKALCLNARHIVSSHADAYVCTPFVLSNGLRPKWKFVFLQHGVTKDNISRWLNGKKIAGMVTSTVDEFASIAGDHSPYKLSAKEVSLTGMPRHDTLAKKASAYGLDERSIITVMPTWRQFLVGDTIARGNRRHPKRDFFESEFLRSWVDVLESSELKKMAEEHECRIMFMPHPNLEVYLPELTLPDHVEVRSYSEI